ncbi:ATP-dependent sacrificial sulfur transferase LarE [Campylobacter sp. RM13119]|uniref:ATP-dependent sacrificial sulfur transferase LarE n=1 Tax=Campylobacter californiensis TaxID=1032243 RepID=UPI00147671B1|nr:ATP-dependent sacrificial sulfur transferase LarE [Campylobacter sp. RM13119]MBE3606157.1 ATP-dependent sacrificial sulfur transferase LarE [Campylobacter sp. RM13119]
MHTKLEQLKSEIQNLGKLAVAFSGGVDSSFLLKVAHDVLGENLVAITMHSPYIPAREIKEAKEFTRDFNISHKIITANIPENIKSNPLMRCYMCKTEVFKNIIKTANELGIKHVSDGTNLDDLGEFRPGLRALKELGVMSLLKNFTKKEIRELSFEMGLYTHDKPSYACLLTRLPQDYKFSTDELRLVEKAEDILIQNGYANIRARFDGKSFKLEMPFAHMKNFITDDKFKSIISKLSSLGEFEITLDLKGFRKDVLL